MRKIGRCSNENMEDGSGWILKEKDRGRFSMRTWKMEVGGYRKRERQRKI